MFLNLTIYPSDKWTVEQKLAAGDDIVDIKFPDVPAYHSTNDVFLIHQKLINFILENYPPCRVLVQGEHTMTYQLVKTLLEYDYIPVAATYRLLVKELEDGHKKVCYGFILFREYEI